MPTVATCPPPMSPDLPLLALRHAPLAVRRTDAAAPRRRLAAVALGVLALHVALVFWLGRAGTWRAWPGAEARAKPMAVRMLDPAATSASAGPMPNPAVIVPEATKQPPAAPMLAPKRAPDPAPTRSRAEAAPATPLADRASPPGTPTPSPSPSPSPDPMAVPSTSSTAGRASASSPLRSLDLTLPFRDPTRPTARSPVLDDPRANTARTTAEQRMARTFDTRVIEESLGDGRVRIRRGDSCVIVMPSRQSELFAGDGTGGPAPRQVMNCP